MARPDFQISMQECENIGMLILDGLSGEHDAVPYQSAGERPAEYDRKSALARTIMRDPIDSFLARGRLMILDGASEYRGHYALDDAGLAEFHRPRLRVLADAGADLLACETLPSLREARVLAALLGEFPDARAWFSFSCKDGEHTSEGDPIGECAAELRRYPQIVAVGVNCTPPKYVAPLLRRMRERTDKPLVAYPNSSEFYEASSKQWRGGAGTFAFGEEARRWHAEGARLIGGCCPTRPDGNSSVTHCVHPAHTS